MFPKEERDSLFLKFIQEINRLKSELMIKEDWAKDEIGIEI